MAQVDFADDQVMNPKFRGRNLDGLNVMTMEIDQNDAPGAEQGPAVPVTMPAVDAGGDTEDDDGDQEKGNENEMDVEGQSGAPQKPQPRYVQSDLGWVAGHVSCTRRPYGVRFSC